MYAKGKLQHKGAASKCAFHNERVELGLGLLGGSGISHFRHACTAGFVAVALRCCSA